MSRTSCHWCEKAAVPGHHFRDAGNGNRDDAVTHGYCPVLWDRRTATNNRPVERARIALLATPAPGNFGPSTGTSQHKSPGPLSKGKDRGNEPGKGTP